LRLAVGLGVAVLAEIAVAFDAAAAGHHHGAVFVLGHAGHGARHLLEALAVGGADLGQEVDVAAGAHAPVEVARQHGLLLLFGHRPLVQVGALVGLEALAVLGLHQAHAELVEPVAFAALLGVEDDRARHVLVGFIKCHGQPFTSSGQ
jgi:hypothetical protein